MGQKTDQMMPYEEALSRAVSLCSRSEHCFSQIEEKMKEWNVSGQTYCKVMDYLKKEKFIDQNRFARAFCHDKFCYNHWGRLKIRQMLRHYKLTDEEIEEGLATIPEEDYLQTLQDLLLAKDRVTRSKDFNLRKAGLMRHLLYKGFETALVVDAVETYLSQNSR